MIMQNWALGQDRDVPIPGYSSDWGITGWGADHDVPFQVTTEPAESAAWQNVVVGQEMASSPPFGSIVSTGDQAPPPFR
jgi:hypothetical protein